MKNIQNSICAEKDHIFNGLRARVIGLKPVVPASPYVVGSPLSSANTDSFVITTPFALAVVSEPRLKPDSSIDDIAELEVPSDENQEDLSAFIADADKIIHDNMPASGSTDEYKSSATDSDENLENTSPYVYSSDENLEAYSESTNSDENLENLPALANSDDILEAMSTFAKNRPAKDSTGFNRLLCMGPYCHSGI